MINNTQQRTRSASKDPNVSWLDWLFEGNSSTVFNVNYQLNIKQISNWSVYLIGLHILNNYLDNLTL
jgi:hypothetical protein